MKHFFVSTPIYYPNAIPHIGHSYSSLIADTIARYKKMSGCEVKFSTGVDENSQKIVEKANELGRDVYEYLDDMAAAHKGVWDDLGIEYTDFMRTTSTKHKDLVQKVLQKTWENGDIYEGEYEGLYCVGCESFKKETDLTADGLCPDHLKAPNKIKEKNYFFRLSKYQTFLEDFYRNNPEFITPENRFTEVKEFVKSGLEDFSISRETNKFGIPLPFDDTQVAYVWYDALLNYISACQDGKEYFWPADLHIVGKDILKFHAIYWPAMLQSAGYTLPKQILATGFFTINGQKISKSLGNAINPADLLEKYGREALLLYLMLAFPIGADGDFDEKELILAYNAKLANNFGNLVNRFFVLALKGKTPLNGTQNAAVAASQAEMLDKFFVHMENYRLRQALDEAFSFSDVLNKYLDTTKPWELLALGKEDEYNTVLFSLGCGIRAIGITISPFFADKMHTLLEGLSCDFDFANTLQEEAKKTPIFQFTDKIDPLFPRIDIKTLIN